MEYVDGRTLREVLECEDLAIPQALAIIEQLAAAVDYAGGRKVVHRDLKPSNVLVTPDGRCKVADFGIAKLVGRANESGFTTQAGSVLGTVAYLSPEQAAGTARIDRRSDVYGLAVMAYEMLVGRVPFPVAADDPYRTLNAHLQAPVPRPEELRASFPRAVAAVLLAGLAKKPRQRPRRAARFWHALEAASDEAWPKWRERSSIVGLVHPAPAVTERPVRTRGGEQASGATTRSTHNQS
jgi:serine/threonine-protein kinase